VAAVLQLENEGEGGNTVKDARGHYFKIQLVRSTNFFHQIRAQASSVPLLLDWRLKHFHLAQRRFSPCKACVVVCLQDWQPIGKVSWRGTNSGFPAA